MDIGKSSNYLEPDKLNSGYFGQNIFLNRQVIQVLDILLASHAVFTES